jgi:hypothetical protein
MSSTFEDEKVGIGTGRFDPGQVYVLTPVFKIFVGFDKF